MRRKYPDVEIVSREDRTSQHEDVLFLLRRRAYQLASTALATAWVPAARRNATFVAFVDGDEFLVAAPGVSVGAALAAELDPRLVERSPESGKKYARGPRRRVLRRGARRKVSRFLSR